MKQIVDGFKSYSKHAKRGLATLTTAGFLVTAGSMMAYAQDAPKTTVSIAPFHSIAAYIMDDVGSPDLLMPATASPHDFALKPSQAELLASSDMIFWVGHELETFLEKPLETIGSNATIVRLIDVPGMKLLDRRTDEAFKKDHDDHDHGSEHKDHDDHAEHSDEQKDHDGHEKHAEEDHDHAKHDDHDHHGGKDPHIWLSMTNAKAAATEIATQLSKLDPENAGSYENNLAAFTVELGQLDSELKADLSPLKDKSFLVYHNAYQYFENDFGLNASGVFSLNPEIKPGAKKLKELSKTIADQNITCIFSEPQFSTKSMEVLIAEHPELSVNTAVLDPLGSQFEAGPKHYFQTMRAMKDAFVSCLN